MFNGHSSLAYIYSITLQNNSIRPMSFIMYNMCSISVLYLVIFEIYSYAIVTKKNNTIPIVCFTSIKVMKFVFSDL